MSSEVETLRKQLQEERHLREGAQRREQEARQREEEAQRLREEDRHRYERRTGKTTLPEFLDACHTHLSLGLTIQPDSTQSIQGDAANTQNKPRPNRILL
jgi:peptide subunit release factor 1 (eRF1)